MEDDLIGPGNVDRPCVIFHYRKQRGTWIDNSACLHHSEGSRAEIRSAHVEHGIIEPPERVITCEVPQSVEISPGIVCVERVTVCETHVLP